VYTCLDEPHQIPALEDEGEEEEEEEEESNDDQEIDNDKDDQDETYTIQSERTLANIVWELDQQASACRRCNRSFNFLVRRHHCR
jgi:hypothetical protein